MALYTRYLLGLIMLYVYLASSGIRASRDAALHHIRLCFPCVIKIGAEMQ